MAQRVIATHPENARAAAQEEIAQSGSRTGAKIETIPDVHSALESARHAAGTEAAIVVTGSIYLVGEAMRSLGVRV